MYEDKKKKIVFSGKLDEDVKDYNVRVMRRGRAVKYFILAFIAVTISVLIYNMVKSAGQSYINFLLSDSGAVVFVPLAFGAFCVFFAVRELVVPKNEKINAVREYSVVFDKENDTITLTENGENKVFPLTAIKKYVDEGKCFTVYYEVKSEEIKTGKRKGSKKAVDKLFALACQKSLMTEGSVKDFTDLLDGVLEKKRAERKERLSKVKGFGIAAIVISLIAIAITYPLFKLGDYILNDYIDTVFDRFFSRFDGAMKIFAGLFFGIFVCIYLVAAIIFGFICYVAPIPLFILALIFLIIQLVYNRKAVSFAALFVFILSFAGYLAILFSGAVVY